MSATFPILLAAGLNEIISVLVGLAFFVIWVINQINDAKKKQAAKEQNQQPAMPPPPAERAAAAKPPQPDPMRAQDPLRDQVDEFLRRAGKQPAQAPPQRKAPQRDEVVVLLDEAAVAPPRKSLAEQVRAQAEAALRRANQSASPASPTAPAQKQRPAQRPTQSQPQRRKSSIAERTSPAKHDFNKEVADLGARVKQADEQFDRQLQKKFDHELGTLGSRPSATPPAEPATQTPSPAAQIAAMLSKPEGVRQAVILNEILHRPSDRW
jgi:hypothetical protein